MPMNREIQVPADSPAAAALTRGRLMRKSVSRRSQAHWDPAPGRDPVRIVMASNEGRIPELVPIRMGRMVSSPFAFLRGSAAVMASDLAGSPSMGVHLQLCGDAHLANFGIYASPERRLVFDLNDFDETLPGPWEWDIKRLAASLVVASRENGYSEATARDMARRAAASYRTWIRTYAGQRALLVWYSVIPIETILQQLGQVRRRGGMRLSIEEAQRRDHLAALGKLSETTANGSWILRHRPPLIQRLPDDGPDRGALPVLYAAYLRSLSADRRVLVEKHRLLDVALKVVGVGSVGTRCYVALFAGPAGGPLVLQVKEARESVIAPHLPPGSPGRRSRHQGERVVTGQRILQAVSDIFLGWTRSPVSKTEYYVRQLHDMKYGIDIAALTPEGMGLYADVCAWALARAHACAGNPALIGGYLGKGDVFDEAIATFAVAYADQTERDHAALATAVRTGRVAAEAGI